MRGINSKVTDARMYLGHRRIYRIIVDELNYRGRISWMLDDMDGRTEVDWEVPYRRIYDAIREIIL